ncbi:MAG: hypoxanthine phosphoribosyltransferase [Deltaproteobacteria bacterium]|nr:hypoxanthine phosphoribosyltransferase [Deltaproteobacteria bacterium]
MVKVDGRSVEVLFGPAEINARLQVLGREIETQYRGRDLVVVGVLKGAFIFMSDLVRHIGIPLACDFLRVASYDHDQSTGIVRMEFDMTQPVEGKDVLLVEDIVDSGRTLRHLLAHLKTKQPRSLKVATLLFKETGAKSRGLVDYTAFECPQRFVVGYGLDSEGLYRSLPFIGAFQEV